MKKSIIWLIAFLFSITMDAQEKEPSPIDWKAIETFATENSDSLRNLIKQMASYDIDHTLTIEQRILAFYGQSYISNDEESSAERELPTLFHEGKYKETIESANKCLEINPMSIDALNYAVMSMYEIRQNGDTLTYSRDDIRNYTNRVALILNTIATTGDGSKEHPFAVTKVSDEYNFMRYYLDLWEIERQFVTTIAGRPCDGFKLQKGSEYYSSLDIYFDITRVFEIERVSFTPKKKK